MNENFLAAYIPETFTVLGKRLQPLSIDHALWLQRLDCDPVDSYEKLITAVLVCSRPSHDIRATLDDRWLRLKLWWWGIRLGDFDINAATALFKKYVAEHSKGPPIFTEEEETGIPGAPFVQHVRVSLITHGWTPDYVASISKGRALWDYYTLWENDGRLEIVGEEHAWMREQANAMHAEILAKANRGSP